jgi:hypothetical protein
MPTQMEKNYQKSKTVSQELTDKELRRDSEREVS